MSGSGRIDQLLQDPRIWQAGRAAIGSRLVTVPSGWAEIDEALNGGWPIGQLIELLIDAHGMGEFALLLPALRKLVSRRGPDEEGGWITLVGPPYTPYAPALARAGVDLSRLLLVRPRQGVDGLWAMEQAMRTQTCAAVVGWSDAAHEAPLRRLQLAAEAGGAWAVLFRPSRLRSSISPAPLRIHLMRDRDGNRLVVRVLKRRGGGPLVVSADIGR